ncbi:hypothetical protein HYZ06_02455 [Candidatus Daviesbacteria bacterium]|nr:hypothetical protein [Candidatus Daviesbacteria bacterium]
MTITVKWFMNGMMVVAIAVKVVVTSVMVPVIHPLHPHHRKFVPLMKDASLMIMDQTFAVIAIPRAKRPLTQKAIMFVIMNTGGIVMELVLLAIKDLMLIH